MMDRKPLSPLKTKTIALVSLLTVVLFMTTLLGVGSIQGTNALAASNSLEGVWMVTVSLTGETPFSDVAIFSHDGSVTIMENDGRLGMGVWEKVSDHRYAFTVWEYWKEGDLFFQAKVRSTVELGNGGKEYGGPFSVQVFVVGNPDPIVNRSGTATGIRMTVD